MVFFIHTKFKMQIIHRFTFSTAIFLLVTFPWLLYSIDVSASKRATQDELLIEDLPIALPLQQHRLPLNSSLISSSTQHFITKDDLDVIFDIYHARCASLCRAALGRTNSSTKQDRQYDDEGGDDNSYGDRDLSHLSSPRRALYFAQNDDAFCATDERVYDSQCALQCMNKHIEFVYKSLGMHKRFVDDVVPQVELLCHTDCAQCLRGNFLPPPRMGPVIRAGSMNDVALSMRRRNIIQRMRNHFYHCEAVCAAYSSSNKVCGSDGREYYKGNNCHLSCANKMLTSFMHNPLLRILVVCEPRSNAENCATCAQRMQLTLLYDQLSSSVEQTAAHHIGAMQFPTSSSSSSFVSFEAAASRSTAGRQQGGGDERSVLTMNDERNNPQPATTRASAVKQRSRICKFCRPDSDAVDCERHYMDYSCSWIADDADTRWCLKITGAARFGGKQSTSLGGGPARWREFTYRSCYSKNVQRLLSALYAVDEDDIKLGECNEVERQSANVTICTCNDDFCNSATRFGLIHNAMWLLIALLAVQFSVLNEYFLLRCCRYLLELSAAF